MKTLRQMLAAWLFGFGEHVEDGYRPPAPVPSMVTVPVTDLVPPVEEPAAALPELSSAGVWCIVCRQPLGGSPSDDFCTDACQREWMTRFGDPLPVPDPQGEPPARHHRHQESRMTATAACKGADTNLFFTRDTETSGMARHRAVTLAATYCRDCPFRAACDAIADRRKEPGLWGGYWRVKDPKAYRKTPLLSYLPHYDTKKAS